MMLRAGTWCLFATLATVACGDELVVLSDRREPVRLLQDWLRPQVHAALDRRLARVDQLVARKDIASYQRELRAKFWESLGGPFVKTPLRPRVVARLQGDGYRVEKIIYESQPHFHVTAAMFLPLAEPPYPAVLIPCGHTENGKTGYQHVAALLARHGIAALCYDPIGQGERKQILARTNDDTQPRGKYRSTIEHNYDGIPPILLGKCLASYRVWDGIRSIDYLCGRKDIDAERIGCTGNSGGGLMTSYLMALDSRIGAAAPGCFITTTRIKNERPGPGDAEQNIFAQTRYGLDHADYLILHAPRPTLVLAATRDFVPIEGTWQSFRQAKRIYGRMGASERVDLVEADEKHGFTQPLRVASVRWFRRWLSGVDDAVEEAPFSPHSDQELRCTTDGQVLTLEASQSIFDLVRDEAKSVRKTRQTGWKKLSRTKRIAMVRRVAGIAPTSTQPKIQVVANLKRNGYEIRKLRIRTPDGFVLPALDFVPSSGSDTSPLIWLNARGMAADVKDGGKIDKLVRSGRRVLAMDMRGYGETATTPWRFSGKSFGNNSAEYFISYMLGQSLVGLRASDVLTAAHVLRHATERETVDVIATGGASVPTMHAIAVASATFHNVQLVNPMPSWQAIIDHPLREDQLEQTVHGGLLHYDLPDLVELATSNGVNLEILDK